MECCGGGWKCSTPDNNAGELIMHPFTDLQYMFTFLFDIITIFS